ncbi:hypothetical protein TNCV_3555181 [Trichonephila clavipes]|nr:hypothetical protein TNCV_3555181 [Trichonephila clavipes]
MDNNRVVTFTTAALLKILLRTRVITVPDLCQWKQLQHRRFYEGHDDELRREGSFIRQISVDTHLDAFGASAMAKMVQKRNSDKIEGRCYRARAILRSTNRQTMETPQATSTTL